MARDKRTLRKIDRLLNDLMEYRVDAEALFDNNIISMYTRYISTRDIKGYVENLYGVAISLKWSSRSQTP